jgi:hypothetical protein
LTASTPPALARLWPPRASAKQPLRARRKNKPPDNKDGSEEGYLKRWIWGGLLELERSWIWDDLLDTVIVVFDARMDASRATPHRRRVGKSMAGDRAGDNQRTGKNLEANKKDVWTVVEKIWRRGGKEASKEYLDCVVISGGEKICKQEQASKKAI